MYLRPIDWAREHVHEADATSLRHMRAFAVAGISEFRRIRGTIQSEDLRRNEWDIALGDDLIDNCLAQRMIEQELVRRGLEP